jgi:hypothetical protein
MFIGRFPLNLQCIKGEDRVRGHDRAAGTLDGNRSPDLSRYKAVLREEEELPGPLGA